MQVMAMWTVFLYFYQVQRNMKHGQFSYMEMWQVTDLNASSLLALKFGSMVFSSTFSIWLRQPCRQDNKSSGYPVTNLRQPNKSSRLRQPSIWLKRQLYISGSICSSYRKCCKSTLGRPDLGVAVDQQNMTHASISWQCRRMETQNCIRVVKLVINH